MTGHLWADALMGVAIALLLMWLMLVIALALGRPKSKLLSESIRLLPDQHLVSPQRVPGTDPMIYEIK